MTEAEDPTNDKDDDEEEEDEDYVQEGMDESDEQVQAGDDDEEHNHLQLSVKKRKAVDDAFREMFGYPYGTRFTPWRKINNKRERILVDMFGPTAAARLLATNLMDRVAPEPLPVAITQKKKTVTEVKRFAGTEVTIERTVVEEQNEKKPAAASNNKQQGLDHVLDQLKGPSKISTVAKTSADWDKFKDQHELDEELDKKAKGKDAYLVKKDFLDRVDHRRFEQERDQRNRERAARK